MVLNSTMDQTKGATLKVSPLSTGAAPWGVVRVSDNLQAMGYWRHRQA
jgi:hypothetical protein